MTGTEYRYKTNWSTVWLIVLLSLVFIVSSCVKQVRVGEVTPERQQEPIIREAGDTVYYQLEFSGREKRDVFLAAFNKFIQKYPAGTLKTDTVDRYITMRFVIEDSSRGEEEIDISTVEEAAFVEEAIEEAIDSAEQFVPSFGGSVTIYSGRTFLDYHLGALTRTQPFTIQIDSGALDSVESALPDFSEVTFEEANENPNPNPNPNPVSDTLIVKRYFTPIVKSDTRIVFELADTVVDAAGKNLSAFDFVSNWTKYIQRFPGEGVALFRYVKGIYPFINGREAVVNGFSVTDKNTITVHLSQPDSLFVKRIATSRCLEYLFLLGTYGIKDMSTASVLLRANTFTKGSRPYLKQCSIVLGNDNNPFLSYSLKKYDCLILTYKKDIDYARAKMMQESLLEPFSTDRYFLAFGHTSLDIRKFLAGTVNPSDMLENHVKAPGKLLSSIESDTLTALQGSKDAFFDPPYIDDQVSILFRKGDFVSQHIAQKLLADISQLGVSCRLQPEHKSEYEKVLLRGNYGIAVGWVPDCITSKRSEQLRLAALWFKDNTSEIERISSYFELPLFTVKRMILYKNDIDLYKDKLSGMYRKSIQSTGSD